MEKFSSPMENFRLIRHGDNKSLLSLMDMESLSTFKRAIDLALSDWSAFQRLMDMSPENLAIELKFGTFTYFAETPDPDVDGLEKVLRQVVNKYIDSNTTEKFTTFKEVTEKLFTVHKRFLDQDLSSKDKSEMAGRRIWLSMESQTPFQQAIQLVFSEWSELETAMSMQPPLITQQLSSAIITFFATTAEPDKDGLGEALHLFFSNELEAFLALPSRMRAAERFLTIYQACLHGNQNLTQVMKVLKEHDEEKLKEHQEKKLQGRYEKVLEELDEKSSD
ncbi:hypothetical protein TorRG33x02_249380 [Trema orientale]|uniref:Uncharacterized protein n=1 Tax=Trema orientale TaxID=63057 RepID=A0A2P5DJM0_TREOI|nr:hypothetical protein TorRG33x02_249380 [Trema orientale]